MLATFELVWWATILLDLIEVVQALQSSLLLWYEYCLNVGYVTIQYSHPCPSSEKKLGEMFSVISVTLGKIFIGEYDLILNVEISFVASN